MNLKEKHTVYSRSRSAGTSQSKIYSKTRPNNRNLVKSSTLTVPEEITEVDSFNADQYSKRTSLFYCSSEEDEKEDSLFDTIFEQECSKSMNRKSRSVNLKERKFFKRNITESPTSTLLSDESEGDDVSKVFKIISKSGPFSSCNPTSKTPIKTYCRTKKSKENRDVIETFALPDTPILPQIPLTNNLLDAEATDVSEVTFCNFQDLEEPRLTSDVDRGNILCNTNYNLKSKSLLTSTPLPTVNTLSKSKKTNKTLLDKMKDKLSKLLNEPEKLFRKPNVDVSFNGDEASLEDLDTDFFAFSTSKLEHTDLDLENTSISKSRSKFKNVETNTKSSAVLSKNRLSRIKTNIEISKSRTKSKISDENTNKTSKSKNTELENKNKDTSKSRLKIKYSKTHLEDTNTDSSKISRFRQTDTDSSNEISESKTESKHLERDSSSTNTTTSRSGSRYSEVNLETDSKNTTENPPRKLRSFGKSDSGVSESKDSSRRGRSLMKVSSEKSNMDTLSRLLSSDTTKRCLKPTFNTDFRRKLRSKSQEPDPSFRTKRKRELKILLSPLKKSIVSKTAEDVDSIVKEQFRQSISQFEIRRKINLDNILSDWEFNTDYDDFDFSTKISKVSPKKMGTHMMKPFDLCDQELEIVTNKMPNLSRQLVLPSISKDIARNNIIQTEDSAFMFQDIDQPKEFLKNNSGDIENEDRVVENNIDKAIAREFTRAIKLKEMFASPKPKDTETLELRPIQLFPENLPRKRIENSFSGNLHVFKNLDKTEDSAIIQNIADIDSSPNSNNLELSQIENESVNINQKEPEKDRVSHSNTKNKKDLKVNNTLKKELSNIEKQRDLYDINLSGIEPFMSEDSCDGIELNDLQNRRVLRTRKSKNKTANLSEDKSKNIDKRDDSKEISKNMTKIMEKEMKNVFVHKDQITALSEDEQSIENSERETLTNRQRKRDKVEDEIFATESGLRKRGRNPKNKLTKEEKSKSKADLEQISIENKVIDIKQMPESAKIQKEISISETLKSPKRKSRSKSKTSIQDEKLSVEKELEQATESIEHEVIHEQDVKKTKGGVLVDFIYQPSMSKSLKDNIGAEIINNKDKSSTGEQVQMVKQIKNINNIASQDESLAEEKLQMIKEIGIDSKKFDDTKVQQEACSEMLTCLREKRKSKHSKEDRIKSLCLEQQSKKSVESGISSNEDIVKSVQNETVFENLKSPKRKGRPPKIKPLREDNIKINDLKNIELISKETIKSNTGLIEDEKTIGNKFGESDQQISEVRVVQEETVSGVLKKKKRRPAKPKPVHSDTISNIARTRESEAVSDRVVEMNQQAESKVHEEAVNLKSPRKRGRAPKQKPLNDVEEMSKKTDIEINLESKESKTDHQVSNVNKVQEETVSEDLMSPRRRGRSKTLGNVNTLKDTEQVFKQTDPTLNEPNQKTMEYEEAVVANIEQILRVNNLKEIIKSPKKKGRWAKSKAAEENFVKSNVLEIVDSDAVLHEAKQKTIENEAMEGTGSRVITLAEETVSEMLKSPKRKGRSVSSQALEDELIKSNTLKDLEQFRDSVERGAVLNEVKESKAVKHNNQYGSNVNNSRDEIVSDILKSPKRKNLVKAKLSENIVRNSALKDIELLERIKSVEGDAFLNETIQKRAESEAVENKATNNDQYTSGKVQEELELQILKSPKRKGKWSKFKISEDLVETTALKGAEQLSNDILDDAVVNVVDQTTIENDVVENKVLKIDDKSQEYVSVASEILKSPKKKATPAKHKPLKEGHFKIGISNELLLDNADQLQKISECEVIEKKLVSVEQKVGDIGKIKKGRAGVSYVVKLPRGKGRPPKRKHFRSRAKIVISNKVAQVSREINQLQSIESELCGIKQTATNSREVRGKTKIIKSLKNKRKRSKHKSSTELNAETGQNQEKLDSSADLNKSLSPRKKGKTLNKHLSPETDMSRNDVFSLSNIDGAKKIITSRQRCLSEGEALKKGTLHEEDTLSSPRRRGRSLTRNINETKLDLITVVGEEQRKTDRAVEETSEEKLNAATGTNMPISVDMKSPQRRGLLSKITKMNSNSVKVNLFNVIEKMQNFDSVQINEQKEGENDANNSLEQANVSIVKDNTQEQQYSVNDSIESLKDVGDQFLDKLDRISETDSKSNDNNEFETSQSVEQNVETESLADELDLAKIEADVMDPSQEIGKCEQTKIADSTDVKPTRSRSRSRRSMREFRNEHKPERPSSKLFRSKSCIGLPMNREDNENLTKKELEDSEQERRQRSKSVAPRRYYWKIIKVRDFQTDMKEKQEKLLTYKLGSLLWAQFSHFPYWPCIITRDPTNKQFRKIVIRRNLPLIYCQVTFLGDNAQTAWIIESKLIYYTCKDDLKIKFNAEKAAGKANIHIDQYVVRERFLKKWEIAVAEAEIVKNYTKQERLNFIKQIVESIDILNKGKRQRSSQISRSRSSSPSKRKRQLSPQINRSRSSSPSKRKRQLSPQIQSDFDQQPPPEKKIALIPDKFNKSTEESKKHEKALKENKESDVKVTEKVKRNKESIAKISIKTTKKSKEIPKQRKSKISSDTSVVLNKESITKVPGQQKKSLENIHKQRKPKTINKEDTVKVTSPQTKLLEEISKQKKPKLSSDVPVVLNKEGFVNVTSPQKKLLEKIPKQRKLKVSSEVPIAANRESIIKVTSPEKQSEVETPKQRKPKVNSEMPVAANKESIVKVTSPQKKSLEETPKQRKPKVSLYKPVAVNKETTSPKKEAKIVSVSPRKDPEPITEPPYVPILDNENILPSRLRVRKIEESLEIPSKNSKPANNDLYSIEAQKALFKRNNLFKGVSKDKVCQYCFSLRETYKCRGGCNGFYHVTCAAEVMDPKPVWFKSKKKSLSPGKQEDIKLDNSFVQETMKLEDKIKSEDAERKDEKLDDLSSDDHVQIITVASNIFNTPPRKTFPEHFRDMSLAERIDFKMKEVMEKFETKMVYIEGMMDSSSDDSLNKQSSKLQDTKSSEVSSTMSAYNGVVKSIEETVKLRHEAKIKQKVTSDVNDLGVQPLSMGLKKLKYPSIRHVTADSDVSDENTVPNNKITVKHVTADAVSFELVIQNEKANKLIKKHITADGESFELTPSESSCSSVSNKDKIDPKHFKCAFCLNNVSPFCSVCSIAVSKKGSVIRQKCSLYQCGRYYHPECLKLWPQTQWSIIQTTKHKLSQEEMDSFVCPQHVCHTCASDDPRAATSRCSGDKIVKCLRCPSSYHSTSFCVPAGTEILSATQIICPRHRNKTVTINTTWCFLCNEGGNLICCETCPTSVHPECMPVNLTEDDKFICEDCESGRLPLYDEIVWVKLGQYKWWPGLILFPNEIPINVRNIKHSAGEFVVRFFGTYNYYWVNRGRSFLFQEGDNGQTSSNRKEDKTFLRAVEEAVVAHQKKKEFKRTQEAETINSLKPPPYIKIKSNKAVGNVKLLDLDLSNTTPCDCNPNQPNPCGPDSNCLNRLLLTECSPEICPAGSKCKNQSFEKREYPPMAPYKTKERGWGLRALAPIKKGLFVIEYVGELIDEAEYQRRIQKMHEQKEENYYFLTIDKDRMIDAGPKGNMARFMNHCCQPNCETQKWTVNGDTRVGLFATVDIPAGTELTFNYNLECIGKEKKVCRCGAPNCSGFIGVKSKQDNEAKKSKKVLKKKKLVEHTTFPPCFICKRKDNVVICNNKICNKAYHLKCLDIPEWPDGNKFVCPWHNCNTCSKRTIRCCVKCINSFCPSHSEGNVRYDNLLGFVCNVHDPTKPSQQETHVRVRKQRNTIITDESAVTSTTSDDSEEDEDLPLVERLAKRRSKLRLYDTTLEEESESEANNSLSQDEFEVSSASCSNIDNVSKRKRTMRREEQVSKKMRLGESQSFTATSDVIISENRVDEQ